MAWHCQPGHRGGGNACAKCTGALGAKGQVGQGFALTGLPRKCLESPRERRRAGCAGERLRLSGSGEASLLSSRGSSPGLCHVVRRAPWDRGSPSEAGIALSCSETRPCLPRLPGEGGLSTYWCAPGRGPRPWASVGSGARRGAGAAGRGQRTLQSPACRTCPPLPGRPASLRLFSDP